MLILLATLILSYLQIDKEKVNLSNTQKLNIQIPISIYLGWITVATIANVTDVLYTLKFTRLGISGEIWAALLIIIAAAITFIMLNNKKDIAYSLVILWAVLGIIAKFPSSTPIVISGVLVCTMIIGILFRYTFLNKKR
jgi:hypothetical protein